MTDKLLIGDIIKYQYHNLDYEDNLHHTTIYSKAKIIRNNYILIYDIGHINLWAPNYSKNQGSCVVTVSNYLNSKCIKDLFGKNIVIFSLDKKISLSLSITQTRSKKIKISRSDKRILLPITQNSDENKEINLEDTELGTVIINIESKGGKNESNLSEIVTISKENKEERIKPQALCVEKIECCETRPQSIGYQIFDGHSHGCSNIWRS